MKMKLLLIVLAVNLVFLGVHLDLEPNLIAADTQEPQLVQEQPPVSPKDQLELIQARERELELREIQLRDLEAQLETKIRALHELEASVRAEVQTYRQITDERIRHLVKIYSSMKPQAAASLMNNIDKDIAVEVFLNMKGEIAGGILAYMDTKKAASITGKLISYGAGGSSAPE
ncbi:MAG: hypothetical protein RRA35_03830 [Desulfomonilia bacterium]|nr:hypothetical protein [Desulfomonilia bacterium]